MPAKELFLSARISQAEMDEVDAHLQRAGVRKSDFVRDAVLARVRGSVDFSELLLRQLQRLEAEFVEARRQSTYESSVLRTLSGAALASSVMLLDDGKRSTEATEKMLLDAMTRALRSLPIVLQLMHATHPNLVEAGGNPTANGTPHAT